MNENTLKGTNVLSCFESRRAAYRDAQSWNATVKRCKFIPKKFTRDLQVVPKKITGHKKKKK